MKAEAYRPIVCPACEATVQITVDEVTQPVRLKAGALVVCETCVNVFRVRKGLVTELVSDPAVLLNPEIVGARKAAAVAAGDRDWLNPDGPLFHGLNPFWIELSEDEQAAIMGPAYEVVRAGPEFDVVWTVGLPVEVVVVGADLMAEHLIRTVVGSGEPPTPGTQVASEGFSWWFVPTDSPDATALGIPTGAVQVVVPDAGGALPWDNPDTDATVIGGPDAYPDVATTG